MARRLTTGRMAALRVGLSVCLAAAFGLAGSVGEANSLAVSAEAARAGRYGLELRLDDAAAVPATEAWVGIGPEKSLQAEIALLGRFWIDPADLASVPDSGKLHFLHLRQTLEPGPSGVRLYLTRASNAWQLGAEVWDAMALRYVAAGAGLLTTTPGSEGGVHPSAVLVEFEWGAASSANGADGYLRVFRLRESPDGRAPVFTAERLRNGNERVSHLRVGVVEPATQPAGTSGSLYIDDVALYRGPAPAAPPADDVEPNPSAPDGPPPHASAPPARARDRATGSTSGPDEARQPDVSASPGGVQIGPEAGPGDPDKRDERRGPQEHPRHPKLPKER